jgi:hypothetical protein
MLAGRVFASVQFTYFLSFAMSKPNNKGQQVFILLPFIIV